MPTPKISDSDFSAQKSVDVVIIGEQWVQDLLLILDKLGIYL